MYLFSSKQIMKGLLIYSFRIFDVLPVNRVHKQIAILWVVQNLGQQKQNKSFEPLMSKLYFF